MNTRFKELVEDGRITLSTPQKKNDRIEVYVEGDINDGDYVNDTHVYSVAEFEQVIDIYTLVQNDDSDYIENIEDEELQEFMRDISPNSPVDGCEVHSLSELSFTYIDGDGNEYPFTLNTKEEARDHKIEKVVW